MRIKQGFAGFIGAAREMQQTMIARRMGKSLCGTVRMDMKEYHGMFRTTQGGMKVGLTWRQRSFTVPHRAG